MRHIICTTKVHSSKCKQIRGEGRKPEGGIRCNNGARARGQLSPKHPSLVVSFSLKCNRAPSVRLYRAPVGQDIVTWESEQALSRRGQSLWDNNAPPPPSFSPKPDTILSLPLLHSPLVLVLLGLLLFSSPRFRSLYSDTGL